MESFLLRNQFRFESERELNILWSEIKELNEQLSISKGILKEFQASAYLLKTKRLSFTFEIQEEEVEVPTIEDDYLTFEDWSRILNQQKQLKLKQIQLLNEQMNQIITVQPAPTKKQNSKEKNKILEILNSLESKKLLDPIPPPLTVKPESKFQRRKIMKQKEKDEKLENDFYAL